MFNLNIVGLRAEGLYLIHDDANNVLSFRFMTTSEGAANSIGNNCGSTFVNANYQTYGTKGHKYQHLITKIYGNYRTFYEGYVVSDAVDKGYLFTSDEYVLEDFYNHLMNTFHLPLLREWTEYLYTELVRQSVVSTVNRPYVIGYSDKPEDINIVHGDRTFSLKELRVVNVSGISDEMLRLVVSSGLKNRKIFVDLEGHRIMPPLNVEGMDGYTIAYGKTLCENLEKEKIRPKSKVLKRSVDGLALLNRKLYAPQASCTNGVVASMFEGDKYIFVSEEMGCGKTIQAAAAVEAYYNQKWLKQHPGKTLKDCFLSGEVKYRAVVMCPSHLCSKWKAEVESQIPGAVGVLITDIAQLSSLRKRPSKERNGKEFFIFSKEFAKGDTYKRPVPTKIVTKKPVANVCYDCLKASANEHNEHHQAVLEKREPWTSRDLDNSSLIKSPMFLKNGVPTCINCGGHNAHLYELRYVDETNGSLFHTGLGCPCCDNLLIRTSLAVYKGEVEDFDRKYVLGVSAFANKTQGNERCNVCGTSLWEDNVQALNIPLIGKPSPVEDEMITVVDENGMPRFEKAEKKGWIKIKFAGDYAKLKLKDKKKRLNKSAFTLRGHETATVSTLGVGTEFVYTEREYGPRRFSPARYVKRYLKGYFDILIADEAHMYEGNRTEQAMAMHWLSKATNFTMLLTGTLTNGTATSLFNIHFMVNPERMKKLGFEYTNDSEDDFSEQYGVVETKRQVDLNSNGNYNAQGKGRQIGSPSVKPGISPMIYPDLLLDHTVQLNIGDMSNHLAPLNEYVTTVYMNEEQREGYREIIDNIREALKTPAVGSGLMGKMLQLGLSYVDKPYGRDTIYSLKIPDYKIVEPLSLEMYRSEDNLLPKEEKLVEIVNKEIAEGRNVFVYTEYSGSEETDIDARLQTIIEKHCNLSGQVKVLKSKDVKAADREEYIKKNASKYKVWITNYRNVETGIDFVGEYEGKKYNYPTIVFFQIGMSLSSVWQASRRHYRLNQTEECRTYYLVYAGTFQLDMLEMMSKKMSAASAIQGNFSESALENMAGSEDPAVVLAKKIMNGQTGGNDNVDVAKQLAEMRQLAIEACDESIYTGDEPVTYYEVMGTDAEVSQPAATTFTVDDMMQAMVATAEEKPEPVDEFAGKSETELLSGVFDFFAEFAFSVATIEDAKKIKNKKARPAVGQMSFF